MGSYKTNYDAPAEALSPSQGGFYLRLQKVGKYDYIASGWWGLERLGSQVVRGLDSRAGLDSSPS